MIPPVGGSRPRDVHGRPGDGGVVRAGEWARSVRLSEVAHVVGIEQAHLPARFKATLTGSQVEVDLAQGYAAAVHEGLAADTGEEGICSSKSQACFHSSGWCSLIESQYASS